MNKSTKQTLEKKMNVIKSILNDEIDADYVSNVLDVAKIEGELMYNRYKRLYKK